ncbi:MAG: hypothetical protein IKW99_03435 [Bacteroidales bacterium]|nr:hypothetical protein [Bacteroidales bacterium]
MPWNSSTEKIIGAANINNSGDIQLATGQSYKDIGNCIKYGCSSGNINKWSKIKPIHYPDKFVLSLADFRGPSILVNEGIVYGLSVPAGFQSPVPSEIHATTWDYVGYPNATGLSGTSPYRFFDFINPGTTPSSQSLVGYSKRATPDIHGEIPSTSMFYINSSQSESAGVSVVNTLYEPNNSEGVAIAEFVVSTSPGEAIPEEDFNDRMELLYPGILVGNYVTALSHGTTDAAMPIRYNGSWVADNWYVDMSKVLGKTTTPGGTQGNCPWSSTTNTTASLVLILPADGTRLAAADSGTDVAQYWVYIPDAGPAAADVWNAEFFPIPCAVGIPVTITKKQTATVAHIESVTRNSSTGITVEYSFSSDYGSSLDVVIEASYPRSSSSHQTWDATKTVSAASASATGSQTVNINWSEFSGDVVHFSGEEIEVTVRITTEISDVSTPGNTVTETIIIP